MPRNALENGPFFAAYSFINPGAFIPQGYGEHDPNLQTIIVSELCVCGVQLPSLARRALLSELASMPVCPICNKELDTVPQRQGVFYHCSNCDGRAVSIPQIRRIAGAHFAVRLLRLLKTRQEQSNSSCPFCGQRLLALTVSEPPLELAGCWPCNIVWFDARNFELVPEWTVANNSGISMRDIETESLRRLKELKEREKSAAEEAKRKKSLRRSLKTLWDQKS